MTTVMPGLLPTFEPTQHLLPQIFPPEKSSTKKRGHEDVDDDGQHFNDNEMLASPRKKSRKSLASGLGTPWGIETAGVKAPDSIFEEVQTAFIKRGLGDDTSYENLKAIYSKEHRDADNEIGPVDTSTLTGYTQALIEHTSSLNKSNADLVKCVLHSDWLGRTDAYYVLFVRLLASIVVTQPLFLSEALRMLAANFSVDPPSLRDLDDTDNDGDSVPLRTVFQRVHKTLRYITHIVPSCTAALGGVLLRSLPHDTESRRAHTVYVRNLLKLIAYIPELRSDLLSHIVHLIVKIDVQVQTDFDDLADEAEEGLVQNLAQMSAKALDLDEALSASDNDDDGDEVYSSDDDLSLDEEALRSRAIVRNVSKMDDILDLLFSHYHALFNLPKHTRNAQAAIGMLISQFVTTILPTHRSRHTQFLLFHFTQTSPIFIDQFVGVCVQKTFDRKLPVLIRQNAAAYLASFVARGAHVESAIVCDVFDYLSSELALQRKELEPSCRGPDLRRYTTYYCLVQALMYIFCFRWRDLQLDPCHSYTADSDDDGPYDEIDAINSCNVQWRSGVREAFRSNLFCNLNPLKVCSPLIVEQFAQIAKSLNLICIYSKLGTNKRVRLIQHGLLYGRDGPPNRQSALTIGDHSGDSSLQYLDTYFPFDPYKLPRSKRWLEGDYRNWSPPPGLVPVDQSDEESSDDEYDEEDNGDNPDSLSDDAATVQTETSY